MAIVLENLAKSLALSYHKAPWASIEDDVALCKWVDDQKAVNINLEQAGKLRKLLEAEVNAFPSIVVYIEGGVLTGVTSTDERTRVLVIDRDNLKEEEDPDQAEEDALGEFPTCPHDVY